jgi:hypothetical protein
MEEQGVTKQFIIRKPNTIHGKLNCLYDETSVSEFVFWDIVKSKVKEITKGYEDKYNEAIKQVTDIINEGGSITVIDRNFEIRTKKKRK